MLECASIAAIGVRRTVMQADELLSDIAFPALKPGERGMFIKLALRRAQAISVVNAAVIVDFDHTNGAPLAAQPVARARIALGSVAPTIVRAAEAEAFLTGKLLDAENIRRAGAGDRDQVCFKARTNPSKLILLPERACRIYRYHSKSFLRWGAWEGFLKSPHFIEQAQAVVTGEAVGAEANIESQGT